MRVLWWSELFAPYIGGVEVLGSRLLPALQRRGHEVAVITGHGSLDLPDRGEFDGVAVHRLPFAKALTVRDPGRVLDVIRRVGALKRELRPDVVHVQLCDPSVFFHLRSQAAQPVPLVVTVHVSPPPPAPGAGGGLVSKTLAAAVRVTAPSQAIRDDVHRVQPPGSPRCELLPHGFEPPPAPPSRPPSGPPTVVCLGRVVEDKGFDLAIDALPAVREGVPGARLVIAGDGPALASLQGRARQLGLEAFVDFLGWVSPDGVHDVLTRAHVVAMPSRWREAFGIVAVQAGFATRPVVASRVGGLPDAVLDGETGLLVAPDDPAALADALVALLRDPSRCARLGAAGREHGLRSFGFEPFVDAHERMYAEAIG